MKIKQTVAAVCLAAIMATSVGAAAEARTREPSHSEGVWDHGVESDGSKYVYSKYKSNIKRFSWAMAVNHFGRMYDDTADYDIIIHGKRRAIASAKAPQPDGWFKGHKEYWDHWGADR